MSLAWKAFNAIPDKDKCCVYNLWQDDKGFTRCTRCATQEGCKLKHIDKPSNAVTNSDLYKLLTNKYGKANGPGKQRPKDGKKSGSE